MTRQLDVCDLLDRATLAADSRWPAPRCSTSSAARAASPASPSPRAVDARPPHRRQGRAARARAGAQPRRAAPGAAAARAARRRRRARARGAGRGRRHAAVLRHGLRRGRVLRADARHLRRAADARGRRRPRARRGPHARAAAAGVARAARRRAGLPLREELDRWQRLYATVPEELHHAQAELYRRLAATVPAPIDAAHPARRLPDREHAVRRRASSARSSTGRSGRSATRAPTSPGC